MFEPMFSEDSMSISYAVDEIDRIVYRVERIGIMPKYEQWLQREAFVRTAYSSTMVENASITEDEMEEVAKHGPVANIPDTRPDVSNYGAALQFVEFVSGADIKPDEPVIRQIHWLLMKGVHDTRLHPGQYRTEPNWIEDQGVKVYSPPFHMDIPDLMRQFAVWLREGNDIKAVLKAGIAHAHLVAIHPFVDGNGRTARLLATLVLQQNNYGFRKFLTLDNYYQRNRDEYITALQQSIGKSYTPGYDFTPWLEFFTESVLLQARKLERTITDWKMAIDDMHNDLRPLGMNERQIDGLLYSMRVGYITRKDYVEITNVSPLTAMRDLKDIVNRGFLAPKGAGRNRKYLYISPAKDNNGENGKQEQEKLL